MRGTPIKDGRQIDGAGIIPAYAGNTGYHPARHRQTRDHPRVCGEHRLSSSTPSSNQGSSPRMRGTQTNWLHGRMLRGIIPAYAGNTCAGAAVRRCCGDHPRVCGEHWARVPVGETCEGSSPRMRGTRTICLSAGGSIGIIPAYAGNTAVSVASWVSVGDHPRVCGEHSVETLKKSASAGSSPRMRGTRRDMDPVQPAAGIIPAYAGNTPRCTSGAPARWDHPRVCGEHSSDGLSSSGMSGSSPRMRGTPC